YYRCMHTRNPRRSSPLLFDPEIERTLRKNRVLLRENRVVGSPNSPIIPRNIMADPQIPPTTDQSTSSFIPTSTQPSPNTIYSPTYEVTPNNTTHPTPTSLEPNHTFSPSTTVPPLSYFFPNLGQSSSTIVHASSSIRPPTQVGSGPIGQTSGIQGDGYGDRYEEEFKGYEEEGMKFFALNTVIAICQVTFLQHLLDESNPARLI
ncbi:hypothetical protein R6Q57_018626, partial [Mikania cordata]